MTADTWDPGTSTSRRSEPLLPSAGVTDPYAYETYAGREGQTFRIVLDDDRRVEATLATVQPHQAGSVAGFSIVFTAPTSTLAL